MDLCHRCVRFCRLTCCTDSEDKEPKVQLVLQNPFIGISDKRYLLGNEQFEVDVYKALDVITQKPQMNFMPKTDILSDRDSLEKNKCFLNDMSDSTLLPARSLEDLNASPTIERCSPSIKKCHSLTTLYTGVSDDPTYLTVMLQYEENAQVLTLILNELHNIPRKGQNTNIYLLLRIFPTHTDGFQSKCVMACQNAKFNDEYIINKMTLENLKKSTFQVTVFVKYGKTRALCEGYLKGQDVNWSSIQIEEVNIFLKRKWLKRQSTSIKYIESDLGELFVLLQYQPVANRMKVLVRKAYNLPKSDKLIGNPGHSVVINLFKGCEMISSRETGVRCGLNAVWNQPFLFTIPNNDTESYYIEFIIVRNRRYTRDDIVGHVIIGPEGTTYGKEHWTETMKPRGLECALWHNIMPKFIFK